MSYVKNNIIRVTLPSDNNYWIDLNTSLTYGEIKSVKGVETDSTEASDKYLALAIKAWNLDDDEGKTLEINQENIDLLQQADIKALADVVNEEVNKESQKKDSSQ